MRPTLTQIPSMRTTLSIDEDVLLAARSLAERQHKSVGEVLSALARQALLLELAAGTVSTVRNGVPLLAVKEGGAPVTLALVNQLRDELA